MALAGVGRESRANEKRLVPVTTIVASSHPKAQLMFNLKTLSGWFRLIADLEGVSFLVLLLIAMPLKYIWDKPWMVQKVGMAHGVLFIAYVAFVFVVRSEFGWNLRKTALALVASFVPFGTFWVNANLVPRVADKV
jgi:integral membrane protein